MHVSIWNIIYLLHAKLAIKKGCFKAYLRNISYFSLGESLIIYPLVEGYSSCDPFFSRIMEINTAVKSTLYLIVPYCQCASWTYTTFKWCTATVVRISACLHDRGDKFINCWNNYYTATISNASINLQTVQTGWNITFCAQS